MSIEIFKENEEISYNELLNYESNYEFIVLVWFVHPGTPGDTIVGSSFRDSHKNFENSKAKIIGATLKDISIYNIWKENNDFKYPIETITVNFALMYHGIDSSIDMFPNRIVNIFNKNNNKFNTYSYNAEANIAEDCLSVIKCLRDPPTVLENSKNKWSLFSVAEKQEYQNSKGLIYKYENGTYKLLENGECLYPTKGYMKLRNDI